MISEQETLKIEGKEVFTKDFKIPEDAKNYDPDYYINNQILPVVERIFDVFGRDKEELVAGKKQMKLGEY